MIMPVPSSRGSLEGPQIISSVRNILGIPVSAQPSTKASQLLAVFHGYQSANVPPKKRLCAPTRPSEPVEFAANLERRVDQHQSSLFLGRKMRSKASQPSSSVTRV